MQNHRRPVVRALLIVALLMPAVGGSQEPSSEEIRDLRRQLREAQRELESLRKVRDRRATLRDLVQGVTPGTAVYKDLEPLLLIPGRARLGLNIETERSRDADSEGVVIEEVVPEGPAAEAGLEAGDILTHWNDEPLAASEGRGRAPAAKLLDLARKLEEGDTVHLRYLRDGKPGEALVKARKLEPAPLVYSRSKAGSPPVFGFDPALQNAYRLPSFWRSGFLFGDIELVPLSEQLGEYFKTDRGLLVLKAPEDGPFGLEAGDVILSIGDREPRDATHAHRILRSYDEGETVNLHIVRHGERITLTATVPEATRASLFDYWRPTSI